MSNADWSRIGVWAQKLRDYKPIPAERRLIAKKHPPRILRVLCQRPLFTGSGVTLVELIEQTERAGLKQFIIFGQPMGEDNPLSNVIDESRTLPVYFKNCESEGDDEIPFPVAGMSDEMPYKSTKFSAFDADMLELYLLTFAEKIQHVLTEFKPDIIHSHHLWLVTALCRVLSPDLPVIGHCHNTALRQLVLAPKLKQFVLKPISDLDVLVLLNETQKKEVLKAYELPESQEWEQKMHVIGTGINTAIFHPHKKPKTLHPVEPDKTIRLIYAGKLSNAKGVPQLIEAYERFCQEVEGEYELLIAGSGSGIEKEKIIQMIEESKERIKYLGQLKQKILAQFLRACDTFILPSFYEGIPLVLLEAMACGCKGIITDLPGLREYLEKKQGLDFIEYIPLPRMRNIDQPEEADLPKFIEELKEAIKRQIIKGYNIRFRIRNFERIRATFGWDSVFKRYMGIYDSLLNWI